MEAKKVGILRELLSHPGETLKEVLESNNMTQKELAMRIGVSEKHITGIITGKNSISPEVASNLAKVFSLSSNFWNSLQANYDSELQEIEEYAKISEEEKDIVRNCNYSDLVKYGYVENDKDVEDRIINMRRFWGVVSLSKVIQLYTPETSPITAFRKSTTCKTNPYAMASWLKMCEVETDNIEVKEYNLQKLKTQLPQIKALMMEYDPNDIICQLRSIFRECGVAFSVVRNLKGAPVQGLIKKVDNKIRLCITLRGAHADIFWFTLFHEIGHLFTLPKDNWRIDYQTNSECYDENKFEQAADKFANEYLISSEAYHNFVVERNFSEHKILEFSAMQKILPCILIGRLKHDGYLPYTAFNNLTKNYRWAD